jgi:ADP-glucose pyrophosphorylase
MLALAQRPQNRSLNRIAVYSIPDFHELVAFCPGCKTLETVWFSNDLAILTDYQGSCIVKYLRQWSLANAARTFHILEAKTGRYKGTQDAVYQNLRYLNKFNTEHVLILAGDHIYKMDFRQMLSFHEQAKSAVTVGVIRVPIEEAHYFNTVSAGNGGRNQRIDNQFRKEITDA